MLECVRAGVYALCTRHYTHTHPHTRAYGRVWRETRESNERPNDGGASSAKGSEQTWVRRKHTNRG